MKKKGTAETAARNAICEYLQLLKNQGLLDFWVVKNVGLYDPKTERFRSLGKWERKGIPDISGFFFGCGIRLDIEVKAPGRGLAWKNCSPEQKTFIENGVRAGCICFAASTVDEVKTQLEYPLQYVRRTLKEKNNEN